MRNALIIVGIGALVLAGGWYVSRSAAPETPRETERPHIREDEVPQPPGASIGAENLVEFTCDDGKKITAVFARDIAALTLSDGRQMELRQRINGSDIRYFNPSETIEFRGEGDAGFLVEGGRTTYANCLAE